MAHCAAAVGCAVSSMMSQTPAQAKVSHFGRHANLRGVAAADQHIARVLQANKQRPAQ